MGGEVARIRRGIREVVASYADVFGPKAARAMFIEARKRVAMEKRSSETTPEMQAARAEKVLVRIMLVLPSVDALAELALGLRLVKAKRVGQVLFSPPRTWSRSSLTNSAARRRLLFSARPEVVAPSGMTPSSCR